MKKLVRAQAGVKLERIKRMAGGRRKQTFYRLTSGRNTSGRVIFDKNEAHRAFAREVAADLEDKVVKGMIGSGASEMLCREAPIRRSSLRQAEP